MTSKRAFLEQDLYPPLQYYLTEQGYLVRSEVNHCDVIATRGDDLVIIELKRSLNTTLLIQAVERQRMTDSVYIAIPRPAKGLRNSNWKGAFRLLRRLELGLIFVSPHAKSSAVQIVFHPAPYVRRQERHLRRAILEEVAGRSLDLNRGGSTRRKIMTAYRENAVHIATCLLRYGVLSPKRLRDLGTGSKTGSILSKDYYGWFERVGRGQYRLKEKAAIELEKYQELVNHYEQRFVEQEAASKEMEPHRECPEKELHSEQTETKRQNKRARRNRITSTPTSERRALHDAD